MGKNFVVVGGSAGIGLGITTNLLQRGHRVLVISRSPEGLEGLGVEHVCRDMRTEELDESDLPEAISGLVYCPGSFNARSFRSLTVEDFRSDFEINVLGAVKTIKAGLKGLRKASVSSVLLFSTVAVGQGMSAHTSIAAAKGAIEGLTRSLAAELAPRTRVNCIAPALTETRMMQKFFADSEKAAALGKKYPLGRTGKPEDFASLAGLLLTDESSWITGQVIGVDGGMASIRNL